MAVPLGRHHVSLSGQCVLDTPNDFDRLGIKAPRRSIGATLADEFSGTLSLTIEYPNLAALADAQAKLANDQERQKYIDKIPSKGLRIQSNSVWADVSSNARTPAKITVHV